MITVKDIREKEFNPQKRGYNEDEVDEFLDEIADQMEVLIRENRSLIRRIEKAQEVVAEPEPVLQPEPETRVLDDSGYFRNLEATLRETLLSAQRLADKTVSEAKEEAEKVLNAARVEAEGIRARASAETATLRATLTEDTKAAQEQLDGLRSAIAQHRCSFREMLQAQLDALGEEEMG
ncbi:MAG: DivIVA domain-containing protein [Candidatus Excrementavichristensenella sp.]|jgi:cell division initiation protein